MSEGRPLTSQAQAYLDASGGMSPSRSVKAQIYGTEKATTAGVRPEGARKDEHTGGAHPTGLAGEPPINKMGVTTTLAKTESVELVMTDDGEIKQVMIRRPVDGQLSVIDWVSFTVLEDTWFRTARETLISDEQIIVEASRHLEKIFGFGITVHRERGMNFYRDSWVLGDEFGFVCFGGQRQTMNIILNGHGCANAIEGWEGRLHEFLTATAIRPVITRIDLAHDDLDGSYLSVDWAEKKWKEGGCTASTGGVPPDIERKGNWHRPTGKGRTLTIGRRDSGKFTRFYEKGKKEGDKSSNWLRCEVEYKSKDRVIPFNVLLDPSSYFAATYPCFAEFAQVDTPERIKVKQQTAHIVLDSVVETTKHQYGKHIRVIRELYGDKEALDLLCYVGEDYWPKRLKPITSTAETSPTPVHRQEEPQVLPWIDFVTAVPSYGLNGDNGFSKAAYQ